MQHLGGTEPLYRGQPGQGFPLVEDVFGQDFRRRHALAQRGEIALFGGLVPA